MITAATKVSLTNMHELSIALSIVELAQAEARRQGATEVKAVHLKLGLLSGGSAGRIAFLLWGQL